MRLGGDGGNEGGGRMWRAFCNRRGKRSAAGTRKWSCELGWISDKPKVTHTQYINNTSLTEHGSLSSHRPSPVH